MAKKKDKKPKFIPPVGWFYMSPESMDAEGLARGFTGDELDVEVWNEAGILEITVAADSKAADEDSKITIDIEACDLDMGDDFSNEFVAANSVKTIFYISYKSSYDQECMPVLKNMLRELGGMLCSDSEDFNPIIR